MKYVNIIDNIGIHSWFKPQDEQAMARIRARHLLNITQAHLALVANLVTPKATQAQASLKWRDNIGLRNASVDSRVSEARRLLSMPSVSSPAATKLFIDNDEAMRVVCTYESDIRSQGDAVAHPRGPIKAADYEVAVHGSRGLKACLQLAVAITHNN
jgi:hypothetical protein